MVLGCVFQPFIPTVNVCTVNAIKFATSHKSLHSLRCTRDGTLESSRLLFLANAQQTKQVDAARTVWCVFMLGAGVQDQYAKADDVCVGVAHSAEAPGLRRRRLLLDGRCVDEACHRLRRWLLVGLLPLLPLLCLQLEPFLFLLCDAILVTQRQWCGLLLLLLLLLQFSQSCRCMSRLLLSVLGVPLALLLLCFLAPLLPQLLALARLFHVRVRLLLPSNPVLSPARLLLRLCLVQRPAVLLHRHRLR